MASVDGTGAVMVSSDGTGGTAYPELLGPKKVDCASERVVVWAGGDGGGLAEEDAVSTVEDVRGAVCVGVGGSVTEIVNGGGQCGQLVDHHDELAEDKGAVER